MANDLRAVTIGAVLFEETWRKLMPEKNTIHRAHRDAREGKAPSTQAGEFIREEMHHIREGKHGARNAKQAIAIGLSKARRAGVKLPPPAKGEASSEVRRKAKRDLENGSPNRRASAKRSHATEKALRKESRRAASHRSLSRQARNTAAGRSRSDRSRAARKAARTRKRHS